MELVQNPGSEDERFATYVYCPEFGSIYTLEEGALVQYPLKADNSGHWWDSPAEVDWARGVEDEHVPLLREVEALLKGAIK